MNAPLLSLRNVQLKVFSREQPILDDLSLDIFPGDFIILLGSNGCGKSSLIKTINGLLAPTAGDLLFNGQSLRNTSIHQRAQEIVTLSQDLNLSTFPDLTVLENCLIALHRNKSLFSGKTDKDLIVSHLHHYNPTLRGKLNEKVASLSGGERQTLALAMSLWTTPKLLLLDEHTSALDPQMAHALMQLTSQVVCSKKITAVMVTHHLNDALTYGNRLMAMNQGKIILDSRDKSQLTQEMLLPIYLRNNLR